MIKRFKKTWQGLNEQGQTLTQKTTRGLIWVGVSNVCLNLTEVFQSLILVYLLKRWDLGIARLGMIAAGLARILTTTGISKALVQSREMDRDLIDTSWVIEIVRNLLQCAALMLLAPVVAWIYKEGAVTLMLRVFALRYVFSAFRNPATQLLIRDMNFRRHEMFERSYNILGFVVTVGAALVFRSYWAIIIGQLFLAFADLVGSYMMFPYLPRFRFDRRYAGKLIKFGKHIYISGILGYLISRMDEILLGKMIGVSSLGVYSVLKGFAVKPGRLLVGVMEPVLFPAIASIQDNLKRVRKSYLRIAALVALVRMPVYAGLAMVAPLLLPRILPAEYHPAIPVFIICCIGMVMRLPVNPLLYAIGRPYLTWIRPLITFLFYVPLVYVFCRLYDMKGVAAALCVQSVIFWTIGANMIRYAIGLSVRDTLKAMALPFLATVTMIVLLLPLVAGFAQPTIPWLIAVILVGVVVFGAMTLTTNKKAIEEIKTLFASLRGPGKQDENVEPSESTCQEP